MKENEIYVGNGSRGYIVNGEILNEKGNNIYCGKCCDEHNIHPTNKNKKDMEKGKELNAIFYVNEDNTKIICGNCGREIEITKTYDDYVEEKRVREEKKRKLAEERKQNVHIVKVAHSWETGIEYFGLSARIDYEDWLKVKKYFHYHTASMDFDDDFYGDVAPRGWVCFDYRGVEKALNIPEERCYDYVQEQKKIAEEEKRKLEEDLKMRIQECEDAFEDAEKPFCDGGFDVTGEVVENPKYPKNIYGGGHWWVIQDDFIWFVRNNGFDGADWGLNNVRTGGAGAIGVRVPFRDDLAEKIRALCE